MKKSSKLWYWSIITRLALIFVMLAVHVSMAVIIPPERIFTWQGNVGVVGGIPDSSTRTVFTTFSTAPTLSQVQTAINNCPIDQVVQLGTWSTTWGGTLDWSAVRSGVILRGSGTNNTKIFFSSGGILMRGQNTYDLSQFNNRVNLTGTPTAGATTFTVASVPSWLRVGELYMISQLEDPNFVEMVGIEDKSINGSECRWCQTVNEKRQTAQINKVTGISGTTITVETPLLYGWDTATYAAQIAPAAYPTGTGTHGKGWGLEDFYVEATYTASQITTTTMSSLEGSWMKNVFSFNSPGGAHCLMYFCYRNTIFNCRFEESHLKSAGQGYGPTLNYGTSYCLIENNIFKSLHIHMSSSYGGGGHVFGYNCIIGSGNDGNIYSGIDTHGSHTFYNLWEGNYCEDKIFLDAIHGSASHQTLLRNYVVGRHTGESVGLNYAVGNDYHNRSNNYVGNAFGGAANMTHKQDFAPSGSDGVVWALGFQSSSSLSYNNSITIDPVNDFVMWNMAASAVASTDRITLQEFQLPTDCEVALATSAPGGLTLGTHYFVNSPSGNTFKLAATPGGAPIDITSDNGSVTVYIYGTPSSGFYFNMPLNDDVTFSGSSAPGGITFGTHYYVIPFSFGGYGEKFKISATPGGAAINLTSVGTSVNIHLFDTDTSGTWLRHGNLSLFNGTSALDFDPGIADHNIPNSLYLAAKPSWFNGLTWPPLDPNTTSTTNFQRIPAGYVYFNNTAPPGGLIEHKARGKFRGGPNGRR